MRNKGIHVVRTRGEDIRVALLSEEAHKSRSVSDVVITTNLSVEGFNQSLLSEWSLAYADPEPGQVESVATSERFGVNPAFLVVEQAVGEWARSERLWEVFRDSAVTPLVCQGAAFHTDAEGFPDAAFCVVWLSPAEGLELHFPNLDLRIPLQLGTTVLFDPAQPHGVVPQGERRWNPEIYSRAIPDPTQHFLAFDLPILSDLLVQRLSLTLDSGGQTPAERGVYQGNQPLKVDRATGEWQHTRKTSRKTHNALH